MPGWWEVYGLRRDPFGLNKPLGKDEADLLVQTRSFQEFSDYFPEDEVPITAIVLAHGTFGAGKSTLLRYLESRWLGNPEVQTHWLNAKLDSTTYDRLEKHLLGSIYRFLVGHSQELSASEAAKSILDAFPSGHHVILVDEVHKVDETSMLKFLREHQAVLEHIKEMPATLIFAGQDALSKQFEGRGGITGVFDLEVPLLPMTEQEALEMIGRRMHSVAAADIDFRNPFTREAISRLVQLADGNPRFILKRARRVLKVNSQCDPPIVIDNVAVARAEEGLSGENLRGIQKKLNSPPYISVRRKLEPLFSGPFGSDRHHDYLAVLEELLLLGRQSTEFEELERNANVFGDLERVLNDLETARVVSTEVRREKGRYGTRHTYRYALDEKVRKFFNLVRNSYKLFPAVYLERIFSGWEEPVEVTIAPDEATTLLNEALSVTKQAEATRFLRRSMELYSELRDLDSTPVIISSAYLLMDSALKAYNIHTRGEPGEGFQIRIENASRDMIEKRMKEEQAPFRDSLEWLSELKRRVVDEASEVTDAEGGEAIRRSEAAFMGLLRLYTGRPEIEREAAQVEEAAVVERLADHVISIESLLKDLYSKLAAIDLRAADDPDVAASRALQFLDALVSGVDFLKTSRCPLLIEGFFEELNRADATISEATKRKDLGLIRRAVIRAIDIRASPSQYDLPDKDLQRKQAISALAGAFEEFLRYVVYRLKDADLRGKLEAKTSTMGQLLGGILGKHFTSRIMKYNPPGLADATEEAHRQFVSIVDGLMELEDEKVAKLGRGPASLLLMLVIRNYEQHTVRTINVSDERFRAIFDQVVLGFLWFYEHFVSELTSFPKAVLSCTGTSQEVIGEGATVSLAATHDALPGGFLVCDLIYKDETSNRLLLYPRDSVLDLAE
ncbi:MAG: AAA family ATPase, partial [Thermoplasmata archaeon]